MKVSLCERCPYKRGDIAGHYDSGSEQRLCVPCRCDPPKVATVKYPRETSRGIREAA